ncbi:HEAT repeat domain-containing protein [Micromonospora robiginosa]|uniref:HEAT repeat domain-containing protein n=1 Tax=Micromonospora robiginosa TaxID=2749844 RepID=A0A7L6B0E8_9ACTN|nr:HEAT repeat domain-containing protein [Micromonospora ferruginea]QLQ35439.1 HEAT repeat domain-containing protein [Micromonospora ferruginea]
MTLADLLDIADGTRDDDPWPLVRELAAGGDAGLAAPARAAFERCVRERNWYGRDLVAHVLAGLSGGDAFPLLLHAFAHRDEDADDGEQLGMAVSRATRADRAAARSVVLPMLHDPDPLMRRAALWALDDVYEPSDLATLREALTDPDPVIRRTALNSLPAVNSDPQAYALVLAALRDPDEWVRHHAVLLLAWSAPPAVVDHLVPLVPDPARYVRSVLGEAIGRRAADSDRVPAADAALRVLLADPESAVRAGAVRGLGLLGVPLDALRTRLDDPDWWVRAAVAGVLATGLRRWPGGRPLLRRLSEDTDPTVRATASAALRDTDGGR